METEHFETVGADGRVTRSSRSVTRREVEWDDGQRLWMLALDHFEAGLCRKCGHHLEQTTNPDNDPDNRQSPKLWEAELPTKCFACAVLAVSEKKYADEEKTRVPAEAWIHTAKLIPRAAAQVSPHSP